MGRFVDFEDEIGVVGRHDPVRLGGVRRHRLVGRALPELRPILEVLHVVTITDESAIESQLYVLVEEQPEAHPPSFGGSTALRSLAPSAARSRRRSTSRIPSGLLW